MLRSRVPSLIPKSLHPPCKGLATASFAPRIQLLPLAGIPAALTAPLVLERLLQEVMGATTAWEGLAEPWAGSCSCPHCCCSDAAAARGGAAGAVPGPYCPLSTRSHPDASFLWHFSVLKEAGEGRGKAPAVPAPVPKAAAAVTALTPFQARGQALSSV